MIALRRNPRVRPSRAEACFTIGPVSVIVQSDLPEVLDDFAGLYADGRVERATAEPVIRMGVRAVRSGWMRPTRYEVLGDGQPLWTADHPREILPYLEWGINWRVIERCPQFVQVHAATLVRNGQGVLLAADSGSGKSTLAAGLLARGWQYLSDEFALIDPVELTMHALPKALCIKAGAFDAVRELGLPLWRERHYVKALKGCVGYIRPGDIRPNAVAAAAPIRWIIFPQYLAGCRPRLLPAPRAQALFTLAAGTLNRHIFGHQAAAILRRVVTAAACYRLEAGPLNETCDVVEELASERVSK